MMPPVNPKDTVIICAIESGKLDELDTAYDKPFERDKLRAAQREDADISPILTMLAATAGRPNWDAVSHLSGVSKTLWPNGLD